VSLSLGVEQITATDNMMTADSELIFTEKDSLYT
jgi:hypothetical protein